MGSSCLNVIIRFSILYKIPIGDLWQSLDTSLVDMGGRELLAPVVQQSGMLIALEMHRMPRQKELPKVSRLRNFGKTT